MTLIHRLSLACALGGALLCAGLTAQAQTAPMSPLPVTPIERLDVARYLGRWYELAKLPNWFQKKCVADTSAEYRLLANGQLGVLNQCRTASGEMQQANGVARQRAGGSTSQLEVRFAPQWLAWLPLVWGTYWVVDLDADYTLAAVSEPEREYLWILARQPQLDPARKDALLQRLAAMGLPVDRLEWTVHGQP